MFTDTNPLLPGATPEAMPCNPEHNGQRQAPGKGVVIKPGMAEPKARARPRRSTCVAAILLLAILLPDPAVATLTPNFSRSS